MKVVPINPEGPEVSGSVLIHLGVLDPVAEVLDCVSLQVEEFVNTDTSSNGVVLATNTCLFSKATIEAVPLLTTSIFAVGGPPLKGSAFKIILNGGSP